MLNTIFMRGIRIFLFYSLLLIFFTASAQSPEFYPSNWWVGMKNKQLQLMVYGKNISGYQSVKCMHRGVTLTQVHRFSNKNYLMLDLMIAADAKPGMMAIQFSNGSQPDINEKYALKARRKGNGTLFAKIGRAHV